MPLDKVNELLLLPIVLLLLVKLVPQLLAVFLDFDYLVFQFIEPLLLPFLPILVVFVVLFPLFILFVLFSVQDLNTI